MYLLDTNMVVALRNGNVKVVDRYANAPGNVFVSGIVVEEILMHGYWAEINAIRDRRSRGDIGRVYAGFIEAIQDLAALSLLPYTEEAEATYRTLKAVLGNRLKKADGRIAAHAVQQDFILVTQNTRDFEHVPGLTLENWAE